MPYTGANPDSHSNAIADPGPPGLNTTTTSYNPYPSPAARQKPEHLEPRYYRPRKQFRLD